MLCKKCQNLRFSDSATAAGYARANDFKGSHQVAGVWFPGKSREDLEKFCTKKCSIEAKPAQAKPVQDTNVNHSIPIVKSVAPPVKGNMPQVKEVKEVKEVIAPEIKKAKRESTDCVDEDDKPITENKDKKKD